MRVCVVVMSAVLATGCGEAFSSRVDVVARAEDYELDVGRLASVLGRGEGLPVRREVVEGLAVMWVNYTLFAHALVSGDSLLDSATVVTTKWPEVQQNIASAYHEMLVADVTSLDSAQVDSVYAAGEYRLVEQVLMEVSSTDPPEIKRVKNAVAEDLRLKIADGLPWADAVQATEEAGGANRQGSLGVIARGDMVEVFENTAYALTPGEISQVIETSFGYHIVYRPPLADVREAFREGVQDRLEADFDDEYLGGLADKWDIEIRRSALPAARQVGSEPVRAKRSNTVLGRYRGGEFRVSDFARWLQAMSTDMRQQLTTATDSQITQILRGLIRNEVLLLEARERGITTTPETFDELRDHLRRELALLGAAMGLPGDTVAALLRQPLETRFTSVRLKVIDYLERLSRNQGRLQLVPPFLADELQQRYEWEIVPAGVETALARARQLRETIDTTQRARPAPPAPPVPDTTGVGGAR